MEADSLGPPSLSSQQEEEEHSTPAAGGLFRRPPKPLKPRRVVPGETPQRYAIREDDEGRFITCLEAPEVKVRVDRSFSVTASAARKYSSGTIFLDGAAQGED